MNNTKAWVIVVIIVILGGMGWWFAKHSAPQQIACTMEAKICPDGSSVGRSGPSCEFAACPGATSTSIGIKTYTDPATGVSFAYPEKLPATYITAVDWPPKIQVENHPLACTAAGSTTARAGQTTKKIVNGHTYCVTVTSEGAAGSIYKNYAYATENKGKTYFFTFSIKEVQCANYDEPNKSACEAERASFSIDNIIDTLITGAFSTAS
jgi:hypothetical protein